MFKRIYVRALLVTGLYLSGCAYGVEHNYRGVTADIIASGGRKVNIVTHDQRSEILSKETDPDVTGWQKGGYGIPYKVTTESDQPLADDISIVVATSLGKKGFVASPVMVKYDEDKQTVLNKLKASGADTLILITMYDWFSNCLINTDLQYNLQMQVLNNSGNLLAEKRVQGKDDLGGSYWEPIGPSKQLTLSAFKKKIEELLNSPDIVKALQR